MRKKYEQYYSVTDEKFNKEEFEKVVSEENRLITKGIEVGHIFYFGDKYSKPMACSVDLPGGKKDFVKMGSYGIGVSRLVGAIIESSHDQDGIKWPKPVAPFDVVVINLSVGNDKCDEMASRVYNMLKTNGKDILYDDSKESAGSKLATMDLIGIPYQIIIGKQSDGDLLEFKEVGGVSQKLKLKDIINLIIKKNKN